MKTKFFYVRRSVSVVGCILIFSLSILSTAQAQTKFSRLFWQNLGETIRSTAVAELPGGGYVIGGTVKDSTLGETDVFMARFSSNGDTIWTRRIAAPGSEGIYDVQPTNDGGYILTGQSYGSTYGILLLKTDSVGNVSWAKVFGNASYDVGYSVRQNADNGFIIAGYSYSPSLKSLIIRTNSFGDTLWTKSYSLGSNSSASFAEETPTGDFIVAMEADTGSFDQCVMLLKINSSGSTIWAKKVTSFSGSMFTTHDVKQTFDGGYLLTAENNFSFSDVMLLKFDGSGNYIFGKDYMVQASNYFLVKAAELADSSYAIAMCFHAITQNDGTLFLRLNQAGDTISTKKYNGLYLQGGGIFTNDGSFVATDYNGGIHRLDSSFINECNSDVTSEDCSPINCTCSNSYPQEGGGTFITNVSFTNMMNVTRKLYTPCTPNVPTCVVTVDSATQKNLVVWEENFDTTFIDSYQVYKESAAAGIYNLIGSVPHNQLSVFLDNASSPAVQAERYRVSALWHTYYEPPNFVAGHKTIHLSISPGLPPAMNLSWSSYEGFTYPTYNIWRGNGISASIIASVPFGTNSYTDLTPPAGDTIYLIEVVHGSCTPTYMQFDPDHGGNQGLLSSTQYNGTISNMVNNNTTSTGINEAEGAAGIFLSPNPVTNQLTIKSSNFKIQSAEVYDVIGNIVLNYELHPDSYRDQSAKQTTVDVSSLHPGIYFVKVRGEKGERVWKFVKQAN